MSLRLRFGMNQEAVKQFLVEHHYKFIKFISSTIDNGERYEICNGYYDMMGVYHDTIRDKRYLQVTATRDDNTFKITVESISPKGAKNLAHITLDYIKDRKTIKNLKYGSGIFIAPEDFYSFILNFRK